MFSQCQFGLLTSKQVFLRLGVVIAALVGLAACSKKEPESPELRPVRTVLLAEQNANLVGEFAAEIKPRIESSLAFRVGGKVVSRSVDNGQYVHAGQVLATLDSTDLKLAQQAALAQMTAAEAVMIEAQLKLKRSESVAAEGFISPSNMESLRASAKATEQQYQQAKAQYEVQRNQAAYGQLVASSAGLITSVDVQPGQVVAAGQVVFRLAQAGQYEVAFAVPESRVDQVRQAGTGHVVLLSTQEASSAQPYVAVLREIAGSADPMTRTYAARAVLQSPPANIHYGMSARISFAQGLRENVLRVPLEALLRQNNKTVVWLVNTKAMTVHQMPVEVLSVTATEVLLKASLPAGAEVVTAGVHQLKEGQKIKRLSAQHQATQVNNASAATVRMQP